MITTLSEDQEGVDGKEKRNYDVDVDVDKYVDLHAGHCSLYGTLESKMPLSLPHTP